jgi:succinoglycan biosynthesis protein ExoM
LTPGERNDKTESNRRIAILICTFRRPEGLLNLLHALAEQDVPGTAQLEIVVVDNDPKESGRPVLHLAPCRWPITYLVEPRPGIAVARTTALAEGMKQELVAFIDDDETPEPDWISELLSAHLASGADAVAGRVNYHFDGHVAGWVREGGFFSRPSVSNGADIPFAGTGNLLLSSTTLIKMGIVRFDEKYRFTGGEDIDFTRRLVRAGGRIVWCETAKVTERVPISRLSRRWALRRAYRVGNVGARLQTAQATDSMQRFRCRLKLLIGGPARIFLAGPMIIVGLVCRQPHIVGSGALRMAHGVGIIGATFGHSYEEYRDLESSQSLPLTLER